MSDTLRMIDTIEAELRTTVQTRAREPVRIRITPTAFRGSITTVLIADETVKDYYKRQGIKEPREVVVHPADWDVIREGLPHVGGDRVVGSPNYGPTFLVGLPIVDDANDG